MSSESYFIYDIISADYFKEEITPSLKANYRLILSQDGALNHVRDKGIPRCKISYKLLKEEYGYDPLLEIYTYPTLIPLKDYFDRIQHCVTVVSKWVFESNFPFALPLKKDNLDYCLINYNKKK